MSQKSIENTPALSAAIRSRRLELNLTIEAVALKAGVGTKTWCRYEAGESIRSDKVKGICKALNWKMLPESFSDDEDHFNLDEYKKSKAWSEYISDTFGDVAAVSFIIGSEILLDEIEEDLQKLSSMPKGSHIGQLSCSMLEYSLPEQFLIEYDYDFVYKLKCVVKRLRSMATNSSPIVAHSVIEELAFYLIIESAETLMDMWQPEMKQCGIEDADYWKEWIYDLFDDMDIVTCLYSGWYLTTDHNYHFSHWYEDQFYMS